MALTANRNVNRYTDQDLRTFECAASHTYRGANVGLGVEGYAGPFVPCDLFVGIAYEEIDNSAGSAGDESVKVYTEGDFEITITGVTRKDIGRPVFCTADNTYALSGHPDGFCGRVVGVTAANTAVLRLKGQHDQLTPRDAFSGAFVEIVKNFAELMVQTGASGGGAAVHDRGLQLVSALGLGVRNAVGVVSLAFDAVAEVAQASVETLEAFQVASGITFELDVHLPDIGDAAALDVDFGLGTLLTANSRASIDHADMVNLACFHMDGNSANILAQSDDNATDVAPVDTTIDNVTDAGSFKQHRVNVRTSGSVEFYINRARVLSSTTFAVSALAALAAFINAEKTSDDTTAELVARRLRVAGVL